MASKQESIKYFGLCKQQENAGFAVYLFCTFFAKRQRSLETYKTLTSHINTYQGTRIIHIAANTE